MTEEFQRLLTMSESQPLSLSAQAALSTAPRPQRSQFSHLVRHFLERFFNHETASPDGDAKTRLVQIACATGLPGFAVALYLWPIYHPLPGWPPGSKSHAAPPSYWLQVNHHLFFVLYSFVALGIATVFEWDLFFPDLLDIFVLKTLPIPEARVFNARVAAIAVLIAGFLFDANFLAPIALPSATDPPNLPRFLAGHLLAVAGSGLFAAIFILALQGVLLSVLGQRLFRKVSLFLQGILIAMLLMLLLLFPVLSGVVPASLKSGSGYALCFPPFWFLGIYQRLLEGPAALPIFSRLTQIGCAALLLVAALAFVTYPLAYIRRVRQLVEGAHTRARPSRLSRPLAALFHTTCVRPPVRRAVFHFIGQTLMRVPRYRIYLLLYGGVGLSVVAATVLRLAVVHGSLRMAIPAGGLRVAVAIVAFWTVAGMRMAFTSSGNRQGSWIFRIVHGNPAHFPAAVEQLLAAKIWVLISSSLLTLGACLAFRAIAPPQLLTRSATAAQILVAAAMCLLLTDIFFLNVTFVAFTGNGPREQPNLAFSVLGYIASFSFVAWLPLAVEPWMEESVRHLVFAAAAVLAAHLALRIRHRSIVRLHCALPALEDDEPEFPMKLGLRY